MRASLPDQIRISKVQLRTARLAGALEFYSGILGLNPSQTPDARMILSAIPGEPGLLVLTEDANASRRQARATGLYHFALRYPTRRALARAYHGIAKAGYPIDGASDHGVSEAIYLIDPDGNGVELYADRPHSRWHWNNGQIAMVTTPLDLNNLLASMTAQSATEAPSAPDPRPHPLARCRPCRRGAIL